MQKESFLTKKLNSYIIQKPLTQKEKNQLTKIQKSEQLQSGKIFLLDFNKDNHWDLLLVSGVYFGPTEGYQFYAHKKENLVYLFESAGGFAKIQNNFKETSLYYLLPIIEEGESNVLYIIKIHHTNRNYDIKKLYYAQQTKLPKSISKTPKLIKLSQKTDLRFSPENVNKGVWQEVQGNENAFNLSKFIKGNIVASYGKNSDAILLAEEENWLFVAFSPSSQALKTSLQHGMESWKKEKSNNYFCGWIQKL